MICQSNNHPLPYTRRRSMRSTTIRAACSLDSGLPPTWQEAFPWSHLQNATHQEYYDERHQVQSLSALPHHLQLLKEMRYLVGVQASPTASLNATHQEFYDERHQVQSLSALPRHLQLLKEMRYPVGIQASPTASLKIELISAHRTYARANDDLVHGAWTVAEGTMLVS